MSKIPYSFDAPVPKYFRENGWFSNEHTFKYVTWAFSRCSTIPRTVVMNSREILLAPFEFISGRLTSPSECFLTENVFRNQQKCMVNAGFLKKTTNSLTNHYTCYIWVTESFCKNNNQQNNQLITNRQPTDNHDQREEKKRYKKDHHQPNPSSSSVSDNGVDSDRLTDDFSYRKKDEEIPKVEVYQGVYLTQIELDACISARGSRNLVEQIIKQATEWPGRKNEITDWVSTVKNWKIKNTAKKKAEDNENFAAKIEKANENSKPWRCRVYLDRNQDCRGLLFESSIGQLKPIFIKFSESDFQSKVLKELIAKGMKE